MTRENKTDRTLDERPKIHRQPSFQPHVKATEHPTLTLVVLGFITLFFLFSLLGGGLDFTADQGEFVPKHSSLAEDQERLEENWPVRSFIFYIEIEDPDEYPQNVTSSDFLEAMLEVEDTLNPLVDGGGQEDGVAYTLSIATLVREMNASGSRLLEAALEETANFLSFHAGEEIGSEEVGDGVEVSNRGNRSLPTDQDEIANLVGELSPDFLDRLASDTNDDGIWDVAVIIVALDEEADKGDIVEEARYLAYYDWEGMAGPESRMTVTGELALEDIQEENTSFYMGVVFPLLVLFSAMGVFQFYRGFKAVLIICLPTFASLVWTFGLVAMLGMTLTPLTLVALPLLLTISLMFNIQIGDGMSLKLRRVEGKQQASKIISGDENPVKRAQEALRREGRAVFTAAIVVMICFCGSCFDGIPALTTLGLLLTLGSLFAFLHAVFMVPALGILIDFSRYVRREGIDTVTEKLGFSIVRNAKGIMAVAFVFFMVSLIIAFPLVKTNTRENPLLPDDPSISGYPSVEAYLDYNDEFHSGTRGNILVEAKAGLDFQNRDYGHDSRDPLELYRDVETIQDDLEEIRVENPELPLETLSMVDLMKGVTLEGEIQLKELWDEHVGTSFPFPEELELFNLSRNGVVWSGLHSPAVSQSKPIQKLFLNIYLESLPPWLREMFLQGEGRELGAGVTHIQMEGPFFDDDERHDAVAAINALTQRDYVSLSSSETVGPLGVEVFVNDLVIASTQTTLFLSIMLSFLTLAFIFKDRGPWWKADYHQAGFTVIPVVVGVGMIPMVLVMAGVSLNLYSVLLSSLVIPPGLVFSIYMVYLIREKGMNIESVRGAVSRGTLPVVTMVAVPVLALSSFFLIPIRAIYNFVLVVMIIHVCFGLGALLFLPALGVFLTQRHKGRGPSFHPPANSSPRQPPTYSGKPPSGAIGKMKHYLWDVPDDHHPASHPVKPESEPREPEPETGQEPKEESSPEPLQEPEAEESRVSSSILWKEQGDIPKTEDPLAGFLSPLQKPEVPHTEDREKEVEKREKDLNDLSLDEIFRNP